MNSKAFEFLNLLPDLVTEGKGQNSSTMAIDKLTCKFVVIKQNGSTALILGKIEEYPYHANLVDRYCTLREIASSWESKPDLVTIHDQETCISGGGWMELELSEHSCRIFGSSTAYGGYSRNEVDCFIKSEPFFNQFKITHDSVSSSRTL